jgi:hypothetical protein
VSGDAAVAAFPAVVTNGVRVAGQRSPGAASSTAIP